MLLYVHRRLFVIGGILFFAIWYFLTFLYSLICTTIYISGTLGYLYRRTRKEVRHQLGLVRTRRKGKQILTQSHNQTINSECNHVNSFNDYYNNCSIIGESKLSDVRYRNFQTAAGPLLINNFVKAKDLSIEDASKANKYIFNSTRYKAPALSNAVRMTATARRRYPINQERYSLIGQLPLVQLNKEPLPILKKFNTTMVHNPVTVKIAPPEDYKRSNSRWKFIYSSSEKSKSRNDPCDARTVIAALKENRKRSSKDKDDVSVEPINTKRQRRDSSSSSGSAFMPTNSSPAGIAAVSNVESSSLNIQKCPNNLNTSLSSNSRNKRPRNNAITSSYSSSKRLMEKMNSSLIHQLAKRKATVMDTSTPKKFIKISDRNEEPPEQKAENVKNTCQSDQNMESDKTNEEVQDTSINVSATSPLKIGVSYRKNLSLYTSLGTPIQAAPMPAHLPTLEEHEKDKRSEAKRLEWLLSGVNEAFQSKEGVATADENRTSEISSTSSVTTSIPSIFSDSNLNKTLPVSTSDVPITSGSDMFNKVAASSSLTLFQPSATTTTAAPTLAVTQVSFLSPQPSSIVTSLETTTSVTRSLFSTAPFSFESQGEKVTSVDSLFGSLSSVSTTSPSITLPQISLSSSTVTTSSISLPISSSVVKPSTESYSVAFPSNITLSTVNSKQTCDSSTVATSSSVSSGLTLSSVLPTVTTIDSLTKQTTSASGGFNFNLQHNNFAFSSGNQSVRHSLGGFNFPFTTASSVVESNLGNKSEVSKIVAITTTVTSPSVSIAVTSSHPSFNVTTSLIVTPSNGLATTTASAVSTTSQSFFPLVTSAKPFIFGSMNGQRQSLFGNAIRPQTELTATQNEKKTVFKTFNSQVPLVPPSIVTVASSNQIASNSFLSSSAMISPNQNASMFGTGGSNALASNITNPFGTSSQPPGFNQNQTVFASPSTAVSQHQAPNFGSNQGTFVSGSTSQSAFMTSGQMQPIVGTTNAFNASTSMQNTFGTSPASAPFQFGTNTGNFNFNFNAPTKYNYEPFGTPAPTPVGSALFNIGSGKLDRKVSSSRRRLAKK